MAKNENHLVLVADDEPSTLALVANHLRSRGYRVIEAADGDEAWNAACRELPDVVVLDVMMPGMSGWEVCRKIREAVSLAHTGVVMLTGIGDTLNELTSPLYGADAYLDKPFQFADLSDAVATTLEQRTAGKLGRPGSTSGPTKGGDQDGAAKSAKKSAEKAAKKSAPKKADKKSLKMSAPEKADKKSVKKSAPKKADKKSAPKKADKKSVKTADKKSAPKKADKKSVKKSAPKKADKKSVKKSAPKKAVKKPAKGKSSKKSKKS